MSVLNFNIVWKHMKLRIHPSRTRMSSVKINNTLLKQRRVGKYFKVQCSSLCSGHPILVRSLREKT